MLTGVTGGLGAAIKSSLLALLLLTLFPPSPADASRDLRQPKSKYLEVNEKLDEAKKELGKIEQAETISLKEIEKISRELSVVRMEHRKRKSRMEKARRDMESAREEVKALEEKVASSKEWLKNKLRSMNRQGKYGDSLLLLGSARDLSNLILRWRYLEKLAGREQKAIESYKGAIRELNSKKAALENAYKRLKTEEEQVRRAADRLAGEARKKEKVMMAVRREKQTYSRIEWELKREAARIKKVISQSVREKEKTYTYKGFRKGKGRLTWPVRGKVAIPFGKHNDPGLHTPVFRNGIYISAPEDTLARSVGKGKVVFADWFEGYGQLVIINHGEGYHTLYANLSEIFLSAGDIIKNKDKVGRVGTSGILNRPALYFEIRYKGKPLNPSQWLTR